MAGRGLGAGASEVSQHWDRLRSVNNEHKHCAVAEQTARKINFRLVGRTDGEVMGDEGCCCS